MPPTNIGLSQSFGLTRGTGGAPVPVNLIESETGLTREVVRKWEIRYGFPRPERDQNGDRVYPAEQVVCLQLIRRLLGAGKRPVNIVGLDLTALELLAKQISPVADPTDMCCCDGVLAALRRHDPIEAANLLKAQLYRKGLLLFVQETVSRLNVLVGESWLTGGLRVFEEHMYTNIVYSMLDESARMITNVTGNPRILLTTAPGELHCIGILMANVVFALEGGYCIKLGPQTPAAEVHAAAQAYSVDIVGLSFSVAQPSRDIAVFLRDLRSQLDPSVEIWAGGLGVARLKRINGVRLLHDLESIGPAIRAWRTNSRTTNQEPSPSAQPTGYDT